MVGSFGSKRLSKLALILCPEINQVFLDVHRCDILQDGSFKIVHNHLGIVLVKRDCGRLVVAASYLEREPCIIDERYKIIMPLFRRQSVCLPLCYGFLFFLIFCFYFLFPCVCFSLSGFSGLGGCHVLWGCPCLEASDLLFLCVSAKTDNEAVGDCFSVLFVLADSCH